MGKAACGGSEDDDVIHLVQCVRNLLGGRIIDAAYAQLNMEFDNQEIEWFIF